MRSAACMRMGAMLALMALTLSCGSPVDTHAQRAAAGENIQWRLGASTVDVLFSLFSAEGQIDLLMTVHVPAGGWPAGEAGGWFEPWSVNYRILIMLAVQRTLEYLDGSAMPAYMTVKMGMESLDTARGRGRIYFPARHSLEWSAEPIGWRFGQDVIWLEPNVLARAAAMARWQPLDAGTWRSFWLALDKRHHLSQTFPGSGRAR